MKRTGTGTLMMAAALVSLSACSLSSHHAEKPHVGPEAGGRTYAQNYKDMVLAECIATAYQRDDDVAKDAGSSVTALREWTYYDLELAPDAINTLIDGYLARDYWNPLVEAEISGVRFDFLKCLDMYHSQELNAQVKRMVDHPRRIYRQDFAKERRETILGIDRP